MKEAVGGLDGKNRYPRRVVTREEMGSALNIA